MDFTWGGTAFTVSSSENVTAAEFSIKALQARKMPKTERKKEGSIPILTKIKTKSRELCTQLYIITLTMITNGYYNSTASGRTTRTR